MEKFSKRGGVHASGASHRRSNNRSTRGYQHPDL